MTHSMLSTLALAVASAHAGPVHQTQVEHRGSPVLVTYRADVDVSTKQIGVAAGPRMSTERCAWTARVGVVREASRPNGAAVSHRLDADKVLSGSRHGSCFLAGEQIRKDVAARDGDVRAHLADVAVRDRGRLLADLDAVQTFASK